MSYILHFDRIGRGHTNIDNEVSELTEKQINPKIQKYLMSRDWEWHIDLDSGKGFLWVGAGSVGFTVKEVNK